MASASSGPCAVARNESGPGASSAPDPTPARAGSLGIEAAASLRGHGRAAAASDPAPVRRSLRYRSARARLPPRAGGRGGLRDEIAEPDKEGGALPVPRRGHRGSNRALPVRERRAGLLVDEMFERVCPRAERIVSPRQSEWFGDGRSAGGLATLGSKWGLKLAPSTSTRNRRGGRPRAARRRQRSPSSRRQAARGAQAPACPSRRSTPAISAAEQGLS